MLTAVVAYDQNRAIGKDGWLPWGFDLPTDLAHFRGYIEHRTVIGGRTTIMPVIGRMRAARTIMLTSASSAELELPPNIEMAHSLEAAIAMSNGADTVFIGGSFERALPYIDTVIATEIDAQFADCDTFFPPLPESEWKQTHVETPALTPEDKYSFKIVTYERIG